jgi:hypothetical protein
LTLIFDRGGFQAKLFKTLNTAFRKYVPGLYSFLGNVFG